MTRTSIAFDVYGTLVDPHGLTDRLTGLVGDKAAALSTTWRAKQLEYSFRHALMNDEVTFEDCTREALIFATERHQTKLDPHVVGSLLDDYRGLPAYPRTLSSLERLRGEGHQLVAFSNGSPDVIGAVLERAGLSGCFASIVSTVEVNSFKPAVAVYRHLLQRIASASENTWLVSSNSFDVLGAVAAGLRAAWVRRSPEELLDPWKTAPTATVSSLDELATVIPIEPVG